jgi:hypothetical protein
MMPRSRLAISRVGIALGVLLGLALTLRAGVSAAQETTEGERVVALNEEGSALYAAGDYRHAVERFLQAYAVDQDPNLLFNIASCYEGMGDLDAALEKYRAFLDAPGAAAEGRLRAERAIDRLLEEGQTAEEPESMASPTLPAPNPPTRAHDPMAARDPAVERAPPRQDPAWLPWVGLGGGATLGALGTTFYLMGASDHDEVTRAPGFGDANAVATMTRAEADDLIRSGNTKRAVGVTLVSIGGALAAGYFVWWLLDPRGTSRSMGSVDVALSGSGARLSFEGQF